VVAAVGPLKAYTVLNAQNVTLKSVDPSTVLTTTARTPDQVVGKMTTRDYQDGDAISTDESALTDPGIAQLLGQNPYNKGKHAFALSVQEIDTFNQGITDNDNVDVLWSRQYDVTGYVQPPSGGAPEKVERQLMSTKTLLQNVKVLKAISLKLNQGSSNSGKVVNSAGASNANQQQQAQQAVQAPYAKDAPPTMVLILAVSDQDAEVIKFARENGIVNLALRAADDTEPDRTTGITDKILVEDYKVVLPELLIK